LASILTHARYVLLADDRRVNFASDRRFQLWAYKVGHAQLLLRSVKGDGHQTRLDVLFKNVHRVELPTLMQGLVIAERPDGGYDVSGDGWSGQVQAGTCVTAEDAGEYFDPSPFAETIGDV